MQQRPVGTFGMHAAVRAAISLGWLLVVTSPLFAADAPVRSDGTREDRLAELDRLETEARRVSPATPLSARTSTLAVLLDEPFQGVSKPYSPDGGVRLFAFRLVAVNLTAEPQTLNVAQIRLRTGGRVLSWQNRPAEVEGDSIRVGKDQITIREVKPPDELTIPGGGVTSTRLLYAGLDRGPFVPEMVLEIPASPAPLELDVNLYERARLRLETARLGPSDCLALLTVRGPLNSINAGSLASALEALVDAGLARAAIVWPEDAPRPDDFMRNWLLQSRSNNQLGGNQQYRHLPPLSGTLQTLHLAGLKGSEDADGPRLHATTSEAIKAALRSAFEVAPLDEVVRAFRSPEAAVRAAAIEFGGPRLPPERLPQLLGFLDAPEPEVRRAVIAALASFGEPAAVTALVQMARGNDADLAEAAVRSLASSRFPPAYEALAEQISAGLPLAPQRLVAVLSAYPRPEWREVVFQLTSSNDSKVQQAAIQALVRLGHPQLLDVLARTLQSSEARVREEAFQQLSSLGRREADELALTYVLGRLQTEPPTGSMQIFLQRVRDQRAVPLLLKHLDRKEGGQSGLIQLLAQIGDEQVGPELAKRFTGFADPEQAETLRALRVLQSPQGKALALQALKSDDTQVVKAAVETLQQEGGSDVVAELANALRALKGNTASANINFICNGLGTIGTAPAREVLLEARGWNNERAANAARNGLTVLWSQSPAMEPVRQADDRLYELDRFDELLSSLPPADDKSADDEVAAARKQYETRSQQLLAQIEQSLTLARRLDPLYPNLYIVQGCLQMRAQRTDAAISQFKRALELNDQAALAYYLLGTLLANEERFEEALPVLAKAIDLDPNPELRVRVSARHVLITTYGIALARTGRIADAIDVVQKHLDAYRQNSVYLYNVACVYGRAVEHLRQDPAIAADDPRLAEYTDKAVEMLQESLKGDLLTSTPNADMLDYMRADPDLQPLHSAPGFRAISEMDLPAERRTRPQPKSNPGMAPGDFAPL